MLDRIATIKQLYTELLEREADAGGLNSYANSGLSVDQITADIKKSSEFRAIMLKKGCSDLDIVFVEPGIAISGSIGRNHGPTLSSHMITHILDTSTIGVEYPTENLIQHLKAPVPATAVISVGDTKKCVAFIKNFVAGGPGRLLISGTNGDIHAAGLLYLWYVIQGMDEDVAETLIMSCRPSSNIKAAMLGPWHFSAAKKVLEE